MCNQPLRKLPDWETPRPMLWEINPAMGFAVPESSALAVLKK
jgi:hypothetical protein